MNLSDAFLRVDFDRVDVRELLGANRQAENQFSTFLKIQGYFTIMTRKKNYHLKTKTETDMVQWITVLQEKGNVIQQGVPPPGSGLVSSSSRRDVVLGHKKPDKHPAALQSQNPNAQPQQQPQTREFLRSSETILPIN